MKEGAKFSRKALNIMIFVTASLILVFSQMGHKNDASTNSTVDADAESEKADVDYSVASVPAEKIAMQDFFPELTEVPKIPEVKIALDIQHWQTPQGMPVYFVESDALPMVDLRLVFDAGSARDPAGQAGLANVSSVLLGLAAKGMTISEVASQFEMMGAQMSTGAYRDMGVASLRVLSDDQYLKPAVDLFRKVVSEMEFSDLDLAREASRQKVAIAHNTQNPKALLEEAVFETLYKSEHPYGRSSLGSIESVDSIKKSDVIEFHRQHYSAKNAVLAMVGDLTRAQAEKIAIEFAQKLGSDAPEPAPLTGTANDVAGMTKHVTFDAGQTHIALVGPGIDRNHEDYYALFLTNHILGGSGFASLLNKTIRQDMAFAYSVGSGISPMALAGPVSIEMQTRSDQAAAAIEATRQVIKKLIEEGPTEAAMADAKQQILSEFALRAASNASQLGYLGSIGFYDLPMDYLETFNDKIEAVSAEDVQKMAAQYFQSLAVVTLGNTDPIGAPPEGQSDQQKADTATDANADADARTQTVAE